MKHFFLFTTFFLSWAAFLGNAEIKALRFILLISTDYVDKTTSLFVETNSKNEIVSLKTRNNHKNRTRTYKTDILHKDIKMVKTAGISLVTLRCKGFKADKGCAISIQYPYNILTNNYKTFHAAVRKVEERWGFFVGEKRIKELRLIAKTGMGLPIGIKRVETK